MSTPVHFAGGPGSRPLTTLSAVAANADGKVLAADRAHSTWGMQVIVAGTGSPTGVVSLELSNDGTNWAPTDAATFTIGTDTNKDFKWAVDKPACFARAVLASLVLGTNTTVTVIIAAV